MEHPDWYPGLNRATANRKAIQEWLHKHKQGLGEFDASGTWWCQDHARSLVRGGNIQSLL